MNKQEVFTKVKNHLLKQGEKAVVGKDNINCKYRTKDGLKCAIGCLIPDKNYNPIIEGDNIYSSAVVKSLPFEVSNSSEIGFDFLEELQHIHDSNDVDKWEDKLKELAVRRGLRYE